MVVIYFQSGWMLSGIMMSNLIRLMGVLAVCFLLPSCNLERGVGQFPDLDQGLVVDSGEPDVVEGEGEREGRLVRVLGQIHLSAGRVSHEETIEDAEL